MWLMIPPRKILRLRKHEGSRDTQVCSATKEVEEEDEEEEEEEETTVRTLTPLGPQCKSSFFRTLKSFE